MIVQYREAGKPARYVRRHDRTSTFTKQVEVGAHRGVIGLHHINTRDAPCFFSEDAVTLTAVSPARMDNCFAATTVMAKIRCTSCRIFDKLWVLMTSGNIYIALQIRIHIHVGRPELSRQQRDHTALGELGLRRVRHEEHESLSVGCGLRSHHFAPRSNSLHTISPAFQRPPKHLIQRWSHIYTIHSDDNIWFGM